MTPDAALRDVAAWPVTGEWIIQLGNSATAADGSVLVRVQVTSQRRCRFDENLVAARLRNVLSACLTDSEAWT